MGAPRACASRSPGFRPSRFPRVSVASPVRWRAIALRPPPPELRSFSRLGAGIRRGMQATGVTSDELQRIARMRAPDTAGGTVLLDLDPVQFATPAARKQQITSILDSAGRKAEELELEHAAQSALRSRLAEAEQALEDDSLFEGSHGLALFFGFEGDGTQALRLPAAVERDVVIDTMPYVRPLAEVGQGERWAVALVSRTSGRIFLGDGRTLREVTDVDDDVHGRHSAGGAAQRRLERSIREDERVHFERVADTLQQIHKGRPIDHLVIGATEEN